MNKRNKVGQLWNSDFYVSIVKSIISGKLGYTVEEVEYYGNKDYNYIEVAIRPEASGLILKTIWRPMDDRFDDTERERTMEISFQNDDYESPEECDNHMKIYVKASEWYASPISKRALVKKIFTPELVSKAQEKWFNNYTF